MPDLGIPALRHQVEPELRHRVLTALGIVDRHLPGLHPQENHGRGGAGARIVRAALQSATTAAELADAFEAEAHRIRGDAKPIRADFRRSDLTVTKEHAEGVLRCLERFPKVNLEWVSRYGAGPNDGSYAHVGSGTSIRFNELSWAGEGQREKYRRSLRNDEKVGWHPKGSGNPMGVAIHEFGHVLDASTGRDSRGSNSFDVVERLLARAKAEGQPSPDIARSVSGYAAESIPELTAEAFADVMLNGDSAAPLSREIFAVLEAAYRKRYGDNS